MAPTILALLIALLNVGNDAKPVGCGSMLDQVVAIEQAYRVDLTLYEDCSVELVDN